MVVPLCFLLTSTAGCTSVNRIERGPNGKPLYTIDALTLNAGYQRASNLCGEGYTIIERRGIGPATFVIECK